MVQSSPGPRPAELIRRLRAFSVSSWRHGDRITAAHETCQALADLTARRAGWPRQEVPDHGETAIADQLAVLAADAVASGVPEDLVDTLFRTLAHRLRGG